MVHYIDTEIFTKISVTVCHIGIILVWCFHVRKHGNTALTDIIGIWCDFSHEIRDCFSLKSLVAVTANVFLSYVHFSFNQHGLWYPNSGHGEYWLPMDLEGLALTNNGGITIVIFLTDWRKLCQDYDNYMLLQNHLVKFLWTW